MNAFKQCFFIPSPSITEHNCPDQTGRVHIVTGGYSGCGLALCKILYQHNATLYIAGRSTEKADKAVADLKALYPSSKGTVNTLIVDLADLPTIKPAVETLMQTEKQLHVLTLNAGVMRPPKGSKSAQGIELQMATNCLGSYLLYKLLRPLLYATSKEATPGSVRVTWAGSLAIDVGSPKPGGIVFAADSNEPKTLNDAFAQYGQSKAGNLVLAAAMAREDSEKGVMHLCWNPGNLKTDLPRHLSVVENFAIKPMLYAPVYGAYTELWSALGDVSMESSGSFVQPWGRLGSVRADIQKSCLKEGKGGNGVGEKFVAWCEGATSSYA